MKTLTSILMLFSLLLQGGGQPLNIPIQNASFEQTPAIWFTSSGECKGLVGWTGDLGWQFGAGSGVFQPSVPSSCSNTSQPPPPTGKNIAYGGSGSQFWQTLSVSPAEMQVLPPPDYFKQGFYTLTFSVANYFPAYSGEYDVEISFGTQQLCEIYGWGIQPFAQVTMTCPGPWYIVADK